MPAKKTATQEELDAVMYPFTQRGIGINAIRRKNRRTHKNTRKYIKIYCYCLRQKTELSYKSIAMRALVSMSQLKVYIDEVNELIATDENYRQEIEDILNTIDDRLKQITTTEH